MTTKIDTYEAVDNKELSPPKGCIRSAFIRVIGEPQNLGKSFYIPEGETMEINEDSTYYIRTRQTWKEATFYGSGSISGPIVVSKASEVAEPLGIYDSLCEIDHSFKIVASGLISAFSYSFFEIITFLYTEHPLGPVPMLFNIFLYILVAISFAALFYCVWGITTMVKAKYGSKEFQILKLQPYITNSQEIMSWLPSAKHTGA